MGRKTADYGCACDNVRQDARLRRKKVSQNERLLVATREDDEMPV